MPISCAKQKGNRISNTDTILDLEREREREIEEKGENGTINGTSNAVKMKCDLKMLRKDVKCTRESVFRSSKCIWVRNQLTR
jgi:hypothetical protein